MRQCDYPDCNNELMLPFKCKLCGQYYCAKHRLPEQHDCPKLGFYSSEEYRKAKVAPLLAPKEKKKEKEKKEKIKAANEYNIYYSKRDKAQTASYIPSLRDRFLIRSPFFTLFAFKRNWLNILLIASGMGLLLALNALITYIIVNGGAIKWDRLLLTISVSFVASFVTFGGQHTIQYITARKYRLEARTVIWVQGAIISLIGILLPFIFVPAYFVFQDFNKIREKAITSVIGVLWIMLCIISTSITLVVNSVPSEIYHGLANVPIFLFWYLTFLLIPIGISNGNYIAMWNRKWLFALLIGNIAIILLFVILTVII